MFCCGLSRWIEWPLVLTRYLCASCRFCEEPGTWELRVFDRVYPEWYGMVVPCGTDDHYIVTAREVRCLVVENVVL